MAHKTEIIAGLDLGTSAVKVVIVEIDGDRRDVIGVSVVPHEGGIRGGHVVALDRTTRAIEAALEEASRMADCHISQVHLSVSGPGTMGFNSDGTVAVRGGRVTEEHIRRVLETASAVKLPADRQLLHTLPQEYLIDGQDGIRDPLGMTGVRLETRVHSMTCSRPALTNAIECCEQAKVSVASVMFDGLASSAAVLSREERELGVVLVDVGGGTTDIAVWKEDALVHTKSLPYGGTELTKQIAEGLRTPREAAEQIKQRHGSALATLVADDEVIEVPDVGGRESQTRQRHLLCEILEPALEELYSRIANELDVAGCREQLTAGVVLTGGTAGLKGIAELGEDVLGLPVRCAKPTGLGGLHDVVASPSYATAVGLCSSTFESTLVATEMDSTRTRTRKEGSGWFDRFRPIIERYF